MNKQHHLSLNIQFNAVLDGIICFYVRFYNNSLLVLKMRFQVQGFSSDRKILRWLILKLFHLQNHVSVY